MKINIKKKINFFNVYVMYFINLLSITQNDQLNMSTYSNLQVYILK
jgi:hypothetical protein